MDVIKFKNKIWNDFEGKEYGVKIFRVYTIHHSQLNGDHYNPQQ